MARIPFRTFPALRYVRGMQPRTTRHSIVCSFSGLSALLGFGTLLFGSEAALARESSDVSSSAAPAKTTSRRVSHDAVSSRAAEAQVLPQLAAKALLGPLSTQEASVVFSRGCESPTVPAQLKPPFLSVSTCANETNNALVVRSASGVFLLPAFSAREHSAVDRLESVRVERGRLLIESVRTEGRFATLTSSFLTVCAAQGTGLSCIGPIETKRVFVGYEGGKEDGHPLPAQTRFAYRWRLLSDDVLSLDPVVKPAAADLSGLHKLRFP